MTKANIQPAQPISEQFVAEIRQIIRQAQQNAVRSVDFCRVQMYWNLGKRILEEEQQGKARAEYGSYLIKNLAQRIEPEYGSGFGERQLKFCRQFYREYPIVNTLRSQSGIRERIACRTSIDVRQIHYHIRVQCVVRGS